MFLLSLGMWRNFMCRFVFYMIATFINFYINITSYHIVIVAGKELAQSMKMTMIMNCYQWFFFLSQIHSQREGTTTTNLSS